MSTFYIPTIAPADYKSFRDILNNNVPDTYDEWLYVARKNSLDNEAAGNVSEPVKVDPGEFSRYLRTVGAEPTAQSLRNFAFQKGSGNQY